MLGVFVSFRSWRSVFQNLICKKATKSKSAFIPTRRTRETRLVRKSFREAVQKMAYLTLQIRIVLTNEAKRNSITLRRNYRKHLE